MKEIKEKIKEVWLTYGKTETVELDGFTLKASVEQDDCGEGPREWDNLGTMVCWHSRYNLGDEQPGYSPLEYVRELALSLDPTLEGKVEHWEDGNGWAYLVHTPDDPVARCDEIVDGLVADVLDEQAIMLPLHLYDHGGITMKVGAFYDPWDSGQVGFIFVSKEDARREYSLKRLSPKARKLAEGVLRGEVETYDDYLTGNVWGYTVEVAANEELDGRECPTGCDLELNASCWGFYGNPDTYMLPECVNPQLETYGVRLRI